MYDHTAQRLHVDQPLGRGACVVLEQAQANYVLNVLRLAVGDALHLFNGQDGEWLARVAVRAKRTCTLEVGALLRPQATGPDIDYLFAPLKHARLDYMVQKATELGVARLRPVITRRTIAERVKLERMRANVIEAAEQCGVLRLPEVLEPVKLDKALENWPAVRTLVFCDEAAPVADPIESLRGAGPSLAVLIGPEGGFDPGERALLMRQPYTRAISLGPRIMRADTAAVAALTLVNAVAGDWGRCGVASSSANT